MLIIAILLIIDTNNDNNKNNDNNNTNNNNDNNTTNKKKKKKTKKLARGGGRSWRTSWRTWRLAPIFRREYTNIMLMFVKSLSYGSIHYNTYPEHPLEVRKPPNLQFRLRNVLPWYLLSNMSSICFGFRLVSFHVCYNTLTYCSIGATQVSPYMLLCYQRCLCRFTHVSHRYRICCHMLPHFRMKA